MDNSINGRWISPFKEFQQILGSSYSYRDKIPTIKDPWTVQKIKLNIKPFPAGNESDLKLCHQYTGKRVVTVIISVFLQDF